MFQRFGTRFGGLSRLPVLQRWRSPGAPIAPPVSEWIVSPPPTFQQGDGETYDLAATGPTGYVAGGVYTVDVSGTALPTGLSLSTDGTITDTGAAVATAAGVIFRYTEPAVIAVGDLVSDGAATPEQISLWLPVTGTVDQTTTATCRYKLASVGVWTIGHPLYRIQPQLQINTPIFGGAIQDGFAWVILDLQPGETYDVEVTVTEGANQVIKTLTHTTRALPAPYTTATGTVYNVSTEAQLRSLLLSASNPHLVPGDVLQLADGVYDTTSTGALSVQVSGNAAQPIYIRGTTKAGTIIRRLVKSDFGDFSFKNVEHVVVENMTIEGDGIDTPNNWCIAFESYNSSYQADYITIRNIAATGIDMFLNSQGVNPAGEYSEGWLVYDNTAYGNNLWERQPVDFLGTSRGFNDIGIILPGKGQVAFNNTLVGFGDAFSHAHHAAGGECDGTAVHFYRNHIRNTTDDVVESDHGRRNITFYDNISYNSMNISSLDPIYAGPLIFARNIFVNLYRTRSHKWNSTNCGQFFYNNTSLAGPVSDYATLSGSPITQGDGAAWYQPSNNGQQRSLGYRNNLMVYRGAGTFSSGPWTLRNDALGYDPCDWTHNSWYPNGTFRLGHLGSLYTGNSLANCKALLDPLTQTQIFATGLKKLDSDNITVSNPWVTTITLPPLLTWPARTFPENSSPNPETTITQIDEYTGTLSYSDFAITGGDQAKNSGVAIPGITDGYTGAAPDRGAVIAGRTAVVYGDRS